MSPTSGPRQNGPQSQTNGRPRRSMACSADRGENDIDVEGRVFSAGNWCRVEGDTATASGFEVLKVFLEFAPAVDPNPRPAGDRHAFDKILRAIIVGEDDDVFGLVGSLKS